MVGMEHAWVLPALPFGAFVVLLLVGRYLPRRGDFLAVGAMVAAAVLFSLMLADLVQALGEEGFQGVASGIDWLKFDTFQVRLGFFFDNLAAVMLAVVTYVGSLIFIYSTGYMQGDPRYGWFFAAMSLFAASMMTLVLADNLLLLYGAWEAVGFCSYLLIGFWHERRSAAEAAKKAFITTRIGDVGFLIGIVLLWREAGTFDLREIFRLASAGGYSSEYLTLAVLMLFAGAVGKSAQFPLHVWLPDAMEGPTPVSALIHAATMVVAGVYLVARTMPLFEAADPVALQVVTAIGLATVMLSATVALVVRDVKRVIAYSTINSLGLMMVALGSRSVTAAMFYLFVHGFFKALLFLSAGNVLHATDRGTVDELGGLRAKMPLTALAFGVGTLAMAGLFPLSGFWAKDEILVAAREGQGVAVSVVLWVSVALTALYMARLYILTFLGKPRDPHAYEHAHEAPPAMLAPVLLLALGAVVTGFWAFDQVGEALALPGGVGKFVYLHEPHPFEISVGEAAGSSALVVACLLVAGLVWSGEARPAQLMAQRLHPLYQLLWNKYYIDDLYQWVVNRIVLATGAMVAWFDRVVVNDTGVDGSAGLAALWGWIMRQVQTGKMPNYALAIAGGAVVIGAVVLVTRM